MNTTQIINSCPTTTAQFEKEGGFLVDVREKEEVDKLSFDVKNILHIPLTEFEERYAEIPKDQSIVMVCRSGVRSLKAAYYLSNKGYKEVKNLDGGIIKWESKGFPVKGDLAEVNPTDSGCCN
ncbi:rhodanese-like domain-containing protein [Psychroflexus montanilacus]|uniref:rhodanese-like domain-containing protein n=1 Tax=Psychroflexus montanilacus TaxID=2873598 RepID=UPI001CCA7BAB|nr:rhodanese-like domain-containing protein [Psychroflexus montanilacus]MBZ9651013.1 rhodanese-like domain-containing protein [Psychroflexus montanilacus]